MNNFTVAELTLAELKHHILMMLNNVREQQKIFKDTHKFGDIELDVREKTLSQVIETVADLEAAAIIGYETKEVEL